MNPIFFQIPLLDSLFLPDSWGRTGAIVEGMFIILLSFVIGYLIRRLVMLNKIRSLEEMNQALEDEVIRLKAQNSEYKSSGKSVTNLKAQISGLQTDLDTCGSARADLQTQLDACRKENASLKAQATPIDLPDPGATKTQSRGLVSDAGAGIIAVPLPKGIKQDDLKVVEGIGPKIEQLLHVDGIKTWIALSQADPAHIKEVLLAAGPRYRIHNPATWPKQAGMAAAGEWKELKNLQDQLKGGREV